MDELDLLKEYENNHQLNPASGNDVLDKAIATHYFIEVYADKSGAVYRRGFKKSVLIFQFTNIEDLKKKLIEKMEA
jgi:hypothetical protein